MAGLPQAVRADDARRRGWQWVHGVVYVRAVQHRTLALLCVGFKFLQMHGHSRRRGKGEFQSGNVCRLILPPTDNHGFHLCFSVQNIFSVSKDTCLTEYYTCVTVHRHVLFYYLTLYDERILMPIKYL